MKDEQEESAGQILDEIGKLEKVLAEKRQAMKTAMEAAKALSIANEDVCQWKNRLEECRDTINALRSKLEAEEWREKLMQQNVRGGRHVSRREGNGSGQGERLCRFARRPLPPDRRMPHATGDARRPQQGPDLAPLPNVPNLGACGPKSRRHRPSTMTWSASWTTCGHSARIS